MKIEIELGFSHIRDSIKVIDGFLARRVPAGAFETEGDRISLQHLRNALIEGMDPVHQKLMHSAQERNEPAPKAEATVITKENAGLRHAGTKEPVGAGDELIRAVGLKRFILDSWQFHGPSSAMLYVVPRSGKREKRSANPAEFGLEIYARG